jgi:succinate dehydrogenase/fumarate reductase flavoprotein subunit
VKIGDIGVRLYLFEAVVVGSGASGFNAASRLHSFGVRNICLVAEHVNAGTSRNTGSDKQTYYKLSLSGGEADSVGELAASLFAGGCVDGDTALAEAALSARCFFRLVELGVPFPHDDYGQYVGYKTDHDPKRRATSAGPYTSKMMTEALEDDVRSRNVPVLDRVQVIRILHSGGRVSGLLCLDTSRIDDQDERYVILKSGNIVWATGGPAGIYADSVYPHGQYGSSGLAFEAGVPGQNLTEWQYGLASVHPRWNVSGSYMQVLPRFISTDREGNDEREFLGEYFPDSGKELSAIFLKGYQWPFDSAKVLSGSSLIDILVYVESRVRGRRVFLDFRSNKGGDTIEWNSITPEAREYLEKAGACFGRPVERLKRMNEPAYSFYLDRGVNLAVVPLEIALSAQHNNGGLCVDAYWQTRLEGFFAVGEVAGTHGVHRPGGSALNAGQVGSLRAASFIAAKLAGRPRQRGSAAQAAQQGQELPSDVLALAARTIELGEKALGSWAGRATRGAGPPARRTR